MTSSGPSRPRTGLTGAWLLLGLACVLYLVMMGIISAPASTDPNTHKIDEAIGEVLGFFFTLMLWIVLAILLLAGGVAGQMQIVAKILLLLSGVAAICAGVLYQRYAGWAIVVPASLPPLIALYAMWARLAALHAALPARVINVAVGGAIVILTAAPLPLSVIDAATYPVRQRQQEAERAAVLAALDLQEAQSRERDIARFQALNADSALGDFLGDLSFPALIGSFSLPARHEEALAKARQVKSRQSDVVALLEGGKIERLEDLWRLDIEATPAVCKVYGDALRQDAENVWKYSHQQRDDYAWAVRDALERQLPNTKWLVREQCDLGAALAAVETRVRELCEPNRCPDTNYDGHRTLAFLDILAALRRPH